VPSQAELHALLDRMAAVLFDARSPGGDEAHGVVGLDELDGPVSADLAERPALQHAPSEERNSGASHQEVDRKLITAHITSNAQHVPDRCVRAARGQQCGQARDDASN
jgi:hypothetical protein